jgi:hypothetical protein
MVPTSMVKDTSMKIQTSPISLASLALAGAMAAALGACGGASAPAQVSLPDSNFVPPTEPAWTQIHSSASCEALDPAACSGAYGFTVQAQGHYIAGPNRAGKTVEGELTSAERAALVADINALEHAAQADSKGQCQASAPTVAGSGASVTIEAANASALVVRSTGALSAAPGLSINTCYFNGQLLLSEHVLADIDQLQAKYYPASF